jgi:hypothetical protein
MIGFTTRTFRPALARGELTFADLARWAAAERFAWMEVRDIDLGLSDTELTDLLAAGERGGVRLHYAWDGTNILEPGDITVFQKGLASGARFPPGTFVRITIAGRVIRDSASARGYTPDELAALRAGIQHRMALARPLGIRLVFENSHEPLGSIRELLEAVPGMELTFDPGNAMDKKNNRLPSDAAALKRFYRELAARIPYVHLKMTRGALVQPVLVTDGDIEPGFYQGMLEGGKLLCIELPEAEDAEDCRQRILASRRILEA